ncbi:hypothetical protein [Ottowia thiooxydans]|uniref:Poly(3-hydroxyalkanoate) polymerase subunit PhaE n=1 Tax=Ottowia thiooxydans TaxID=219182 RepID=A0ABV2Q7S5_9BURK
MSKSNSNLDPLKTWREWFVKNEREWSESITKLMKDESVAQSMGQEINAAIHRQQMFTQGLASPMASMNIPSRADVVALGERIGHLEDSVARVEAALVRMESRTKPSTPRTRGTRPAAKSTPAGSTPVGTAPVSTAPVNTAPKPTPAGKAAAARKPAKRASRA